FFSSRRRHTRSKRDWSSDVCSSDLTNRKKNRSDYERLPEYTLSQMKRGTFCGDCFEELQRTKRQSFLCLNCKQHYHVDDVVLFAVAQFHILFPEKKITVSSIMDWCAGNVSKKVIRRILCANLDTKLNGKRTHDIFNDQNDYLNRLS